MTTSAAAALLLQFDIAEAARDEHDAWHTHEHMPERLALPGFLRGSRWTALGDGPRYVVLYEVADLDVLDSPAYRARLDAPTPWTAAMMKHYQRMSRSLCRVAARTGAGLGTTALVVRFTAGDDADDSLQRWLAADLLPSLADRPGFASAVLLRQAAEGAMTREQAIRGRDASTPSALMVTGYTPEAVGALAERELAESAFTSRGVMASGCAGGLYRLAYAL